MMPPQQLNRKLVWSTKKVSKCRFFISGLYIFLQIFFFHRALHHHALRCTVDTVATTKWEVGVEHQKSIKMQVFRLWTLKFKKICFDILREASTDHEPPFTFDAVAATKPEVGVVHQKRQNTGFWSLDLRKY